MVGIRKGARSERKNRILMAVLEELGWSQVKLVAEVCAYMGQGYISRSTVSEWVSQGRVPRDPLPAVVAHVLSDAVGRKVTAADLWQNVTRESSLWISADHGLKMSWDDQSVINLADDWIANAGEAMNSDRRHFMALSGAALTLPAVSFLENRPAEASAELPKNVGTVGSMKVTPSMVDVLESTIREIEVLDDHEGGDGNNLRFVHSIFSTIAGYVRSDNFADSRTRQRVLTAWAQVCRIGGFMAFDAGCHGYAQRLFRTGLQVTHNTGDRQLGAHILVHLSQQAVYRGYAKDAIHLAEAGMETAKGTSLAVRALINWEYARAQAAMGNVYACQAAMEKARDLVDSPNMLATRPSYLYWLNAEMMESNNGHSLLTLAQVSSRHTRRLVTEAEKLLTPYMASTSDFRREFSRQVLLRGSWLARGYLWCGELEQAVQTGRTLLELVPSVRSHQAITVLRRLSSELVQYRSAQRTPYVAEFSENLQRSLATAAV